MAFLFTDSHLFKDKQAKLCILKHATQSIWIKGQLSKTDFWWVSQGKAFTACGIIYILWEKQLSWYQAWLDLFGLILRSFHLKVLAMFAVCCQVFSSTVSPFTGLNGAAGHMEGAVAKAGAAEQSFEREVRKYPWGRNTALWLTKNALLSLFPSLQEVKWRVFQWE